MKTKEECYKEIYQYLCNCQDLSEEAGNFDLRDKFESMRHLIDKIRFGYGN